MNEIANYPSLKDKLVLITGGAGYIGSLLSETLLKNNHHVTIIDNFVYSEN